MSLLPHDHEGWRNVDAATGLRTPAAFHRDLPLALAGARRSGNQLTLVLVAAGLGTGEAGERRTRRLADALLDSPAFAYRLGETDFALVAPDTTALQTVGLLDHLVGHLSDGDGRTEPEIVAGVAVSDGWHAPRDLTIEAAEVLRRTWAESTG